MKARADLQLKAGQPLQPDTLRQTIVKAGFTPTWIRFEAVGQLVVDNGNAVFKVQGTEQLIPLVMDEQLKALRAAIEQGGTSVAITGLLPAGKKAAQVERFERR